MFIKVMLTGHITSQCCHLTFHGGDLVSLITFEGTILYQAVSCFSVQNLPLVFQSVLYLYFKNVRVNMNGKMEGNGVDAKLLSLISVYEFPYYCNTIYLIIMDIFIRILII